MTTQNQSVLPPTPAEVAKASGSELRSGDGLGASAPTATTYTKSYSGGGYFDNNPLAYITVKVGNADVVRVPAALLKQLVQDLDENDGISSPNKADMPICGK